MDLATAHALVISGSMGAGKTTVLGEASDLLRLRQIVHAAIDLDALGLFLLQEAESEELHDRNLATVFRNCRQAGIGRFLIAAAIESRSELERVRRALEGAPVTICRLTASTSTMTERLRTREVGMRQQEFVERSGALDAILEANGLEDFRIANDGRSITDVAREMLHRANWLQ